MSDRTPQECDYCWRVLYSKAAKTHHMRNEHWEEIEAEAEEETADVAA